MQQDIRGRHESGLQVGYTNSSKTHTQTSLNKAPSPTAATNPATSVSRLLWTSTSVSRITFLDSFSHIMGMPFTSFRETVPINYELITMLLVVI